MTIYIYTYYTYTNDAITVCIKSILYNLLKSNRVCIKIGENIYQFYKLSVILNIFEIFILLLEEMIVRIIQTHIIY